MKYQLPNKHLNRQMIERVNELNLTTYRDNRRVEESENRVLRMNFELVRMRDRLRKLRDEGRNEHY